MEEPSPIPDLSRPYLRPEDPPDGFPLARGEDERHIAKKGGAKRKILAVLLLILMVIGALSALTYFPEGIAGGRSVATRGTDGSWSVAGLNSSPLGYRLTSTEISRPRSSNVWARPDQPLACERLWIHDRTGTAASRALGLALQASLLEDAFLSEVTYLVHGAESEVPTESGDIHLTLEILQHTERLYPGFMEFSMDVRVSGDSRPPLKGPKGVVRTGRMLMEASLGYHEVSRGPLTQNRRYTEVAKTLVDVVDLHGRLAVWRAGGPSAR